MMQEKNLILVGVISSAHGIKGHVIVKSYTEIADNITKLPIVDTDNQPVELKLIRTTLKGEVICKFKNCDNRNEAELLKGIKLYCLRDDFPSIANDEFYVEDLRGMRVVDESKQTIGTVLDIANYGAGDILEIKFEDNKSEMFPFTEELFPTIEADYIVFARSNLRIK